MSKCCDFYLQTFSSVYFTLLSSFLHIDSYSISVLHIWLCFDWLCILTFAVLELPIYNFAFLFSAYWHLQYFISVYLSLISSSLHIDIPSISVLHIWLWFPCLCILTSAVFQFCIFDPPLIVSALWHLQYFIFLYLTFLSLSLHIDICSISVLYYLLCFRQVYILTYAVFQFFIF